MCGGGIVVGSDPSSSHQPFHSSQLSVHLICKSNAHMAMSIFLANFFPRRTVHQLTVIFILFILLRVCVCRSRAEIE